MHHAPSPSDMPGYLLPENMHELLLDVIDELQLLAALAATTEAPDGQVLPMELKRAALAGYLRRVSARIETALGQCSYPARFSGAGAKVP
ncbi:MAG: hypothetical protein KGJ32_07085 [Xanthomonadaceae bacterium]|nr:hypothetical protein [Xanthomonadaceae bacterium]